jgi:hypothetical protein
VALRNSKWGVKLAAENFNLFETLQGNETDFLLIPFELLTNNQPTLRTLTFKKQATKQQF